MFIKYIALNIRQCQDPLSIIVKKGLLVSHQPGNPLAGACQNVPGKVIHPGQYVFFQKSVLNSGESWNLFRVFLTEMLPNYNKSYLTKNNSKDCS